MPDTTPRRALPFPVGSDPFTVASDLGALALSLDQDAPTDQGTFASRPAASLRGRLYFATDTQKLYWDTGSAWVGIGPGEIADLAVTTAKIADAAVTGPKLASNSVGSGNIVDAAVETPKVADAAISAIKLAAALKPSQGAGGTDEALRALGTSATQAYPGNSGAAIANARRTCLLQRNGSLGPLVANVWTPVDLNVETSDPDGMASAGVVFIPATGTYLISGRVHNGLASSIQARVFDVDSSTELMHFEASGFEDVQIQAFAWPCPQDTILRLEVRQVAGGSTLTSVPPYGHFMSIAQIK